VSVNRGTGDRLVGLSVRGVRVNRGTGDRLVGVSVRGVRLNRGTGDRFVGLSIRGVRVNIHLSLLMMLRASVAVTAHTCRGRLYLIFLSKQHIRGCSDSCN
jgi:hypothetical protein